MNSQNLDHLDEYLRKALNLETASECDMSHISPFQTSGDETDPEPYYHPSVLLDMNWNDGDDDVFILNMFKKVFACQDRSKSVDPPVSTLTVKTQSGNPWIEENRYLPSSTSSTNMVTEYISVPTSKHVAQILGKNGSKIRALRETTNTFIRSPLPREESIFLVKGKKEGVFEAVQAIKSASDFFTSLESEKQISRNAAITSSAGHVITVKFSIPEHFVGLVVGIKGVTIKEIEKQTKAYIQSPSIDSDPIFTITGSPENCQKAMNFISRYLALRGVGPGTVENVEDSETFFTWIHVGQARNN